MIGGLLASGLPPWFMVAHSGGERFEGLAGADGRAQEDADRDAGASFRLGGLPMIGPGSWRLALRTLRSPQRHTPAALLSGWLPRGSVSTEPLKDTVRRVVPRGWVGRDGVWIVACDYETGRRVPFGRRGAPAAEFADAVARRARSRASTRRSASAGGTTSTEGSIRPRTSTCCAMPGWTSSSA